MTALASLVLVTSVTMECRADDTNADYALLAGATTIVVPLSIGSALVANGQDLHVENLGVGIMEGGLVLAPLVTHLVTGETKRGLLFSAIPAFFAAGTATLYSFVPDTIEGGKLHIQYLFAASFIGCFLGSTIGIVDGLFAPARARERTSVTLLPLIGRGQTGLAIGGVL
jgi:hypothetical protein